MRSVQDIARLAFFFSYQLQTKCPVESLESILRERSPLYHVALGLDPYSDTVIPVLRELPPASNTAEFELKMYKQCAAFIEARGYEYYPVSQGMGVRKGIWQAESLKFDPPRAETPQRCGFHIANAKAPGSIFDDPAYLPKCLLRIADLAEAQYGATELSTSSWLNNVSKWLSLFPQEFTDNRIERTKIPLWHLGYWGQIINARGLYHVPNGEYARKQNELRYSTYFSFCSIEKLRKHLKGYAA